MQDPYWKGLGGSIRSHVLGGGILIDVLSRKWESFSFPLPSPSSLSEKKITGSSCITFRVDFLQSVLLKNTQCGSRGSSWRVRWPMSRDKVDLWWSPCLRQALATQGEEQEDLSGYRNWRFSCRLLLRMAGGQADWRSISWCRSVSSWSPIAFNMDYQTKGTDKRLCQGRSLTLLGVLRKPFYSSLFHGIRGHFNFAPGSR